MTELRPAMRAAGAAALFWAGWTFVGLFFGSRMILGYAYAGTLGSWKLPLVMSLAEWYGWAVLSPAIFWLARRCPLESPRVGRAVLLHIGASVALSVLKVGLDSLTVPLVTGVPVRITLPTRLHPNLLTYWIILGLALGLDYYRRYRDRELRASQLESRLARAQLESLRAQLHPHFLFNTLHAVSALMYRDAGAADRMLVRLSELLRFTLDHSAAQEVTLAHELELAGCYLEIERVRLGSRLRVMRQIDPATLDALVPTLVLQPLIENAVRHGVAARPGPGTIRIRSAVVDGRLHLQVADDGPGLQPGAGSGRGIGLANTRERLSQLYGAGHRFSMGPNPEVRGGGDGPGMLVSIEMPLRRIHSGTGAIACV